MRIYLDGIGILGPGLLGWKESWTALANETSWAPTPAPNPMPTIFAPNERRRCSETVRWAVQVAQEALEHSQRTAQDVATVFTCSDGDGAILHRLCETLTTAEPMISPTSFHQSVHNAPAGYFSIAHRSVRASTSLACYDGSFGAGLFEAAAQIQTERTTVLLVSYDVPGPPPLHAARPIPAPLAIALVIAGDPSPHSLAEMSIEFIPDFHEDFESMSNPELEQLRREIPTGRALPLLASIARRETRTLCMEYVSTGALRISVRPMTVTTRPDLSCPNMLS